MTNLRKFRIDHASLIILISFLAYIYALRDELTALVFLFLMFLSIAVSIFRFPESLVKKLLARWVDWYHLKYISKVEIAGLPASQGWSFEEHLISIVVPAYNSEATVSRTIESALDQTSSQWELIIVNDGSTDSTLEVMHQVLKGREIRYQILSTGNNGLSAARNLGLEASRGDFVSFLDADDFYLRNFVQEALNAFQRRNDFDAGVFRFYDFHEDENLYSEALWSLRTPKDIHWLEIQDWAKISPFSLTQPGVVNKVFRRSMIDKSGLKFPDDRNVIDDLPTTYCWLLSSRRTWGLGRPLSVYRRKQFGLHSERLISPNHAGATLRLTAERLQSITPGPLKAELRAFLRQQAKYMAQGKDQSWKRDFLTAAGDLNVTGEKRTSPATDKSAKLG